jgi:hypothetical protein
MIRRPSHGAGTVSPRIDVRVDPDLVAALRARAPMERRSVSEIVRSALREYLDRVASRRVVPREYRTSLSRRV